MSKKWTLFSLEIAAVFRYTATVDARQPQFYFEEAGCR
jgi:hypothetical protein